MTYDKEISDIFKTEFANLVAILCRFYGIENIQLAEDIVSDAFIQAMRTWAHNGIPDSPKAWLRTVAVNKAKDQFRRSALFEEKIKPQLKPEAYQEDKAFDDFEISDGLIEDSQLNMMFAVSHPSIPAESRICLALRILCGMSIDEIAAGLLSNRESINKKLYRAKQKLNKLNDEWLKMPLSEYQARLDNVLRIIYLIFNEGYYSGGAENFIRNNMCWEAMRLAVFLSKQKQLPNENLYALLSLMCFNASRIASRTNEEGEQILYENQNRGLWDQNLIAKGKEYLHKAAKGEQISDYHLEAAIAFWHTTEDEQKWNNILQLYNKLLMIKYSPIIAMNRTYALALANSVDEALGEAKKLELSNNHFYQGLLAELYRLKEDTLNQILHLKKAMALAQKESEKTLYKMKLEFALYEENE